jgi:hypothetical protein
VNRGASGTVTQGRQRVVPSAPRGERSSVLNRRRSVIARDDYLIYEDAVEEYHALGWGTRGDRMRILIGELMSGETVPFPERYGWNTHRRNLAADLQRAGLPPRFADA